LRLAVGQKDADQIGDHEPITSLSWDASGQEVVSIVQPLGRHLCPPDRQRLCRRSRICRDPFLRPL